MATAFKKSIVKKKTNRFARFQSDRFNRVKESWRKPRGIDNRVRRKFRGSKLMPKIGYGSDKATRFQLQNGLYPFVVKSAKDIDMLLMHNEKFAAVIAHNLNTRSRKAVVERAAQLGVKVVNQTARLTAEERE
jgi:ribosomal protein L32E